MSTIRSHTNRLQGEIQMLQMRRRTLHPHLHQSENNRREVCKLWRPSPRQLHRMQIPPHTSKKKTETPKPTNVWNQTKQEQEPQINTPNQTQTPKSENGKLSPKHNETQKKTQNKTDQIA
jgi:hypothetical protein